MFQPPGRLVAPHVASIWGSLLARNSCTSKNLRIIMARPENLPLALLLTSGLEKKPRIAIIIGRCEIQTPSKCKPNLFRNQCGPRKRIYFCDVHVHQCLVELATGSILETSGQCYGVLALLVFLVALLHQPVQFC